MNNQSSYPTTKTIEGWFQYGNDREYGPTLIQYVGREQGGTPYPLQGAKTDCEVLVDKKWEEVFPFGEYWGSNKTWRAKITIEIFEEKTIKDKEPW